jgi:hypothetical protein
MFMFTSGNTLSFTGGHGGSLGRHGVLLGKHAVLLPDPQRLTAQLDSTLLRLCSYLQFENIGIVKYAKKLQKLYYNFKKSILSDGDREMVPCFHPSPAMTGITYPLPTLIH